jgi:predicted TIM-barrel fold metal-dependent hydrolase
VDGHVHYWDASPENWVEGQEQYAKGWIESFYGYHQLGPEEYYWPMEKYQRYSEETMMKDLFEDGHVDKAIFLPTYLKAWYKEGFNTIEQDAVLAEKYPDRFILNGRFDPRDGEEGLRELEDPEAKRYLEKCEELGVKNIHVHKGPTIWPLNKDAFDVKDVDDAATSFPNLNFIVEHVGLPRIEDFCFMATQEPNVYAGLSVALGALMHSRPRFFAKVMGELLFWVGEDKMLWASDYAIWHPKWQVEMFVDWDYPEGHEYDDFPRLSTEGKKKILGLNAARLYDIEVPAELRLPEAETESEATLSP